MPSVLVSCLKSVTPNIFNPRSLEFIVFNLVDLFIPNTSIVIFLSLFIPLWNNYVPEEESTKLLPLGKEK